MSIEEKLRAIEENEHKVYEAGVAAGLAQASTLIDDSKIASDSTWSSKNIVDKVCPVIEETGSIVTCEPVEGYPLTVTSAETSSIFTRYGKNLLDLSEENVGAVAFVQTSGAISEEFWGIELILPPGTYTIKAIATGTTGTDYIYGAVTDLANTKRIQSFSPVINSPEVAKTATFSEWVRLYIYNAAAKLSAGVTKAKAMAILNNYNIQLEVGNTATDFEPYNGEEFSFTNEDGIATATVPALPGVNTIFADAGEVTVTGRADPTAVINKLTNAIVTLGGNV